MKDRFKLLNGKVTDDGHVMLKEDIIRHMNNFYNYFLEKKKEEKLVEDALKIKRKEYFQINTNVKLGEGK